ncbi:major facilitator superfamily domain-containing protein [Catenaria anguillulae PL171]|uniref:Major facilitator superfamily domain-containing protein n=1 Tax=Catenaria anguillulae PL171 TaxID=765915 RepID=A0A1Y2HCD6_9FUNG|nr:major facilitator superfamily domain-containing protein [Catenaria anguillulae PL171]
MFILSICILSEPVSLSILFPFVYFMVKDFEVASNDATVGYYVGVLASIFSLAQFVTSALWGLVSDRYGRKPVLLMGLLGNTATMLTFGASKSYPMAIVSRMLCGFLNANLGAAKCVLGEISDDTNQDFAFAVFGLAWGLGGIFGPMVGGLLSNPAKQYPELFGSVQLLIDFPYLLPCLVAAFVSMVGFVCTLLFLDETHPAYRRRYRAAATDDELRIATSQIDEESPLLRSSDSTLYSNSLDATNVLKLDDHLQVKHPDSFLSESDSISSSASIRSSRASESTLSAKGPDSSSLSLGPAAYHAVTGYALVTLHTTLFDEIFALFAVQPSSRGGLLLTSAQLGTVLGIVGVFELLVQLIAYPLVARRVSLMRMYIGALFVYPLAYVAFPSVALVLREGIPGAWDWAVLLGALLVRLVCSVFCFTPIMVMVNNSAPSNCLGRVNGLGQTAAAAVRGIGPAIGTMIFAWSTAEARPFPINSALIWLVLAALAGMQLAHASYLPVSLNFKFRHPRPRPTSQASGS